MNNRETLSVTIAGGGLGKRFGAKKQFEIIYKKAVIIWSALPFLSIDNLMEVIFVVPGEDVGYMEKLLKEEEELKKISFVVAGGILRQDSTKIGLENSSGKYVAIHDAVRPLITTATIKRCLNTAKESGGCIVADKSVDTVKDVDENNKVRSTLNREHIYLVKTPQIFQRDIFLEAFKRAFNEGFVGTDSSSIIEKYGLCDIYVVEDDEMNIKITQREDLSIAETILKDRYK